LVDYVTNIKDSYFDIIYCYANALKAAPPVRKKN